MLKGADLQPGTAEVACWCVLNDLTADFGQQMSGLDKCTIEKRFQKRS